MGSLIIVNIKACPNCHTSILYENTTVDSWIGWVRCEICAYMEPIDEKVSKEIKQEIKQLSLVVQINSKTNKSNC